MDGSELAEASIPYAHALAGELEAKVFLLHVCPPEHSTYLHMHQIYVNAVADRLRRRPTGNKETEVEAEIITGDAVKVIFDYVKLKSIDMVVITTHGISGQRPWAMGNVADKIIRGVGVPVLLIRTRDVSERPDNFRKILRILLPLDNSDASKISVPYAIQMAKQLGAGISLYSMAPTSYAQNYSGAGMGAGMGAGIGINWDVIDASTKQFTEEFLLEVEKQISKEGIQVDHTSTIGLDAAYEILEMEKKLPADLVVMATRGRSTIARWALGSVAEKVLREGTKPLLLVKEP